MAYLEHLLHITDSGDYATDAENNACLDIAKSRIKELENQLAIMAKRAESAENERDRLKKCFSQIEILMAKYRIPEEGD